MLFGKLGIDAIWKIEHNPKFETETSLTKPEVLKGTLFQPATCDTTKERSSDPRRSHSFSRLGSKTMRFLAT